MSDTAFTYAQCTFDYLIVGAGAGGLSVAARLSEDPSVSVGLIEAGIFHVGDPNIDVPQNIGQALGDPIYDWGYASEPQKHAGGTVIPYPRGKMIGGSTSVNFLAWSGGSKEELDVWAKLIGSDEWSWKGLSPYFSKAEQFQASEASDPFPSFSGLEPANISLAKDGVVPMSYQALYPDNDKYFVKTCNALGIPTNLDPFSGTTAGVYNVMNTIDRKKGIRAHAGNTYFADIAQRPNVKVLTGAQATKIVFSQEKDKSGRLAARSVNYNVGGVDYSANVTKDIIVSGGTFDTPKLLELSGIGNAKLLKELGIEPLIDLPEVGTNLQDHFFTPAQFELNPGVMTFDELRINPTFAAQQAAQYNESRTGWLAASDSSAAFFGLQTYFTDADLTQLLSTIDQEISRPHTTPLQRAQYEVQRAWIKEGRVPQSELIMFSRGMVAPAPNTSYVTLMTGAQASMVFHPFSRGTVHINSSDFLAKPVIDVNALSSAADVSILTQQKKMMDRFSQTAPFSEIVARPSLPTDASDEATLEYVKKTIGSGAHPLGTAAMAKRELGGVVDSSLRVYGTSNLRIVDASIIPLAFAMHTQSLVYAIGEKAAEIIKHGK